MASTDTQLWEQVCNDDIRAFNELYGRYWKKMFSNAYVFLKDQGQSEDLVQDIFIHLWNKRKELHIASFPGYLAITLKHRALNALRSAKKLNLTYRADLEVLSETSCTNHGEQRIRGTELMDQLNACLNFLPTRCREIFIMSRVQQLSNEEIAIRLNVSKRTVENQVSHALKHLRLSGIDFAFLLIMMGLISS